MMNAGFRCDCFLFQMSSDIIVICCGYGKVLISLIITGVVSMLCKKAKNSRREKENSTKI